MLRFLLACFLYAALSQADPIASKAAEPSVQAAPAAPAAAVIPDAKTPRTAAAAAAAALDNIKIVPESGPTSCPPSHLFSPCECFVHGQGARIIRCSGNFNFNFNFNFLFSISIFAGDYNIDLNPVFQRLSIYLPKPDKHFHMFYLNNTNLTYLGNVFHDITFEYICK